MDKHIDWLSFTLDRGESIVTSAQLYHEAKELLRRVSNDHKQFIFDGAGFDVCGGRAPYRYALARDDNGVRLFGGGAQTGILYEVSGRACEGFRSLDSARAFLSPIIERVTRLDYACDIRADTKPSDFSNKRSHQGFRSISYIKSSTGETVYVGSPKSDRFCRAYRYNHPHPRAHLLRIEFVFRRGLARDAARALCGASSEETFAAALGNTYGFIHPVWQPGEQTDERLRVPVVMRGQDETVSWLYKQVAPALRRLLKEDAINLADWLEFVMSQPENV